MSTSALENLREYLTDTLSPRDMIWLSTQLAEYARQQDNYPLKRYTLEEMKAQLFRAEKDFKAGKGISNEDVMREWEEELGHIEHDENYKAVADAISC